MFIGSEPALKVDVQNWGFLPLNVGLRYSLFRLVFSERELMFMFAICRRPSVCRLSVVCSLSVTFVHSTQPIEIFGNVSAPCNTLVN